MNANGDTASARAQNPRATVYTVEIAPSGRRFQAQPGESVLDAALRQGILLPYGCRNGVCGSCKGKLLEGSVHYPEDPPEALTRAELEAGWALLCQARGGATDLRIAVEEIDRSGAIQVRTLPARVMRKELLAHDVAALYLRLPESERLQFRAGQYVDVLLRDGRRRAFSLANAPHDDEHLVLHVRHVPGGVFSGHVFNAMKERALLRIHGPLGGFYLRQGPDRPLVLMAGGTGFAPIKAMVENALAAPLARDIHLYWGVRARRDLYLHELASRWAADHPRLRYTPVLSEPRPEDRWRGRSGFVHEAVLQDFDDMSGLDVYTSGPPAMVAAARETFVARGLPIERLRSDAFQHAHETGHDG